VPSLLPLPTLLPCLPELEGAVINKMRMLPLLPRPDCHQQSPIAACIAAAAELEGAGIYKMRMLQKMRLLEEKGATFASTPIKDLPVFGEQLSLQNALLLCPPEFHVTRTPLPCTPCNSSEPSRFHAAVLQ
jgi:hypothetical protein